MSETSLPYSNEDNGNVQPIQVSDESFHEIPIRKDLVLSYISINFLKEIAKWTKFISIVGFLLVGFLVLIGISFSIFFSSIASMIPPDLPNEFSDELPNPVFFMQSIAGFIGFSHLILASFYFFPVYYLFNFSSKLKNAILMHDETQLEMAWKNLKSHYKFIGVLLIVVLSFYALMLLGGILGLVVTSML